MSKPFEELAPLRREDLEEGFDPQVVQELYGKCHQFSGITASYHQGVLTLRCHFCAAPVVRIKVAEGRSW